MEKIPTAYDFQEKYSFRERYDYNEINYSNISHYAIEFAKLHVKAALKAAADEAEVNFNSDSFRYTIENAYSEENIK